MIHDGFIYLGTLMLLAAILVNLPVPDFVRRDSGKTFYNTDIRTG